MLKVTYYDTPRQDSPYSRCTGVYRSRKKLLKYRTRLPHRRAFRQLNPRPASCRYPGPSFTAAN